MSFRMLVFQREYLGTVWGRVKTFLEGLEIAVCAIFAVTLESALEVVFGPAVRF
jgi:hypothetical protein